MSMDFDVIVVGSGVTGGWAVVEAAVAAVADGQHAHLDGQQPVLALVVDDRLGLVIG